MKEARERRRWSATERGPNVRIDQWRLERGELEGTDTIVGFLAAIRAKRRAVEGRVLAIRRDDVRALAAALHLSTGELRQRLAAAGAVPDARAGAAADADDGGW